MFRAGQKLRKDNSSEQHRCSAGQELKRKFIADQEPRAALVQCSTGAKISTRTGSGKKDQNRTRSQSGAGSMNMVGYKSSLRDKHSTGPELRTGREIRAAHGTGAQSRAKTHGRTGDHNST